MIFMIMSYSQVYVLKQNNELLSWEWGLLTMLQVYKGFHALLIPKFFGFNIKS